MLTSTSTLGYNANNLPLLFGEMLYVPKCKIEKILEMWCGNNWQHRTDLLHIPGNAEVFLIVELNAFYNEAIS